MDQRFWDKTSLKVSKLCLGTMTFARGAHKSTSHAAARLTKVLVTC